MNVYSLSFSALSLLCLFAAAYLKGYGAGRRKGFREGHLAGHRKGQIAGHKAGVTVGRSTNVDRAFRRGLYLGRLEERQALLGRLAGSAEPAVADSTPLPPDAQPAETATAVRARSGLGSALWRWFWARLMRPREAQTAMTAASS